MKPLTILLLLTALPAIQHSADPFGEKLAYLAAAPSSELDRETRIAEYRKLIDQFPDDPRKAEAMFEMAKRIETLGEDAGSQSRQAVAQAWFRQAVRVSDPSTKSGADIRIFLAERLQQYGDEKTRPERIAESRALLDQVAATRKPNDWVTYARVEKARFDLCLITQDFDAAERHCVNVVEIANGTLDGWYATKYNPIGGISHAANGPLPISGGNALTGSTPTFGGAHDEIWENEPGPPPSPLAAGHYIWKIDQRWTIDGGTNWHVIPGGPAEQRADIAANGDVSIQKAGIVPVTKNFSDLDSSW